MLTINAKDLLLPANLTSLSRVLLAPIICYFIWLDTSSATLTATILMILAGITDALDGYLARLRQEITPLGIALDPICDKLFAIILVVGLILFRDLPIWLAITIVGRDLLILIAASIVTRKRDISLPSNLTGKYAFAAIVALLASYLIRFEFGISLLTPIVLLLIVASLIGYILIFFKVTQGGEPKLFVDSRLSKYLRIFTTLIVSTIYFIKLYLSICNS